MENGKLAVKTDDDGGLKRAKECVKYEIITITRGAAKALRWIFSQRAATRVARVHCLLAPAAVAGPWITLPWWEINHGCSEGTPKHTCTLGRAVRAKSLVCAPPPWLVIYCTRACTMPRRALVKRRKQLPLGASALFDWELGLTCVNECFHCLALGPFVFYVVCFDLVFECYNWVNRTTLVCDFRRTFEWKNTRALILVWVLLLSFANFTFYYILVFELLLSFLDEKHDFLLRKFINTYILIFTLLKQAISQCLKFESYQISKN